MTDTLLLTYVNKAEATMRFSRRWRNAMDRIQMGGLADFRKRARRCFVRDL
jgi:hypothetical protein